MNEKWLQRLKAVVPAWVLRTPAGRTAAVFKAMASMMADIEKNLGEHIAETYIDTARGDFLNMIGDGRGKPRQPGEHDSRYRIRIKSIVNASSCPDIKSLIDPLLVSRRKAFVGSLQRPFTDGRTFADSGAILQDFEEKNTFAVIVPRQVLPALSFADSGAFADNTAFAGSLKADREIFDSIYQIVENEKAFGTLWMFLERSN